MHYLGTLRADFSLTGDYDRWGVVQGISDEFGTACDWVHGIAYGYSLHQNPDLDYPFATPIEGKLNEKKQNDTGLKGTLLRWTGNEPAFVSALQQCNHIEGFDPNSESGLYKRAIVPIHVSLNSSGHSHSGAAKREMKTTISSFSSSSSSRTSSPKENSHIIQAYLYYQKAGKKTLQKSRHFPNGDWLAARSTQSLRRS